MQLLPSLKSSFACSDKWHKARKGFIKIAFISRDRVSDVELFARGSSL